MASGQSDETPDVEHDHLPCLTLSLVIRHCNDSYAFFVRVVILVNYRRIVSKSSAAGVPNGKFWKKKIKPPKQPS